MESEEVDGGEDAGEEDEGSSETMSGDAYSPGLGEHR